MKKTFLTLAKVKEIEKEYPTPFYVYDEAGIRKNIRRLERAFSWNKGFKEYFAIKALPTPGILKLLKEEGCGMDCSSHTELMLAEALGFVGHEIMFSSNVTFPEDYVYANSLGGIINLDDFSDIDLLASLIKLPDTLCMRYNPGGSFSIHTDIMDKPGDAKYGMTRAQLIEGVKKLSGLGVRHFGVHAFLASNTVTNEYYPTLAGILFELALEIKQETGVSLSFINLSGGIGIPYKPDVAENDIDQIGAMVREKFEKILVPAGLGDISIFTELARFVTGPYGALIATAIHEKQIYKNYIGLDACSANLMRPAMYGAYHHITVLGKESMPLDHVYDVTGGLCENNDKFAIDRPLPKIDLGDKLYIHDAGAHSFSMGYNYNGKLRSAELLLKEDGGVELLRRAEKPADYFATFDFLDLFKK